MAKGRKTGGGSRLGSPNKVTAEARIAIATFVDGNAHRLQDWLDKIAEGVKVKVDGKDEWLVEPDPTKAFELFQSVIEYHVPKLARTELVGDKNAPVSLTLKGSDIDG